jgi:hypothetical protein
MKPTTLLITLIGSLSMTVSSYAWGEKGHTIVAEIAFQHLDASTKANVMKYLGDMTLMDAANWMDRIKSDDSKDFMRKWHYFNLEKGATEMPGGDNVITALSQAMKDLDNKTALTDEQIKEKILILFHLIGDLHQPMHVGYGSDRGGNNVKLSFYGNARNLHSIWDTEIVENKKMTYQQVMAANPFKTEEIAEIQKINIPQWVGQSRSHLNEAYKVKNGKVDVDYLDKHAPAVRTQLAKAGLRLAAVLQKYFS